MPKRRPKRTDRKKQISAQTRVKQSQASKRRQRGPKGTVYGGRFLAGLAQSGARHHARSFEDDLKGARAGRPVKKIEPKGMAGPRTGGALKRERSQQRGSSSPNEIFSTTYQRELEDLQRGGMRLDAAERKASRYAYNESKRRTGLEPDLDIVATTARRISPTRSSIEEAESAAARINQVKEVSEARRRQAVGFRTVEEKRQRLPRDLQDQLSDPESSLRTRLAQGLTADPNVRNQYFASYGERERHRKLVDALDRGLTLDESINEALEDRRGRRITAGGVTEGDIRQSVADRHQRQGRKSRTERLSPRPGETRFGVQAPAARSISELERRWPDATRDELVKIREVEKQAIIDEFVQNQAWAHETRRAKLKGATGPEGPDKVTFFTTSLGFPAVSVPSDSLMGQYVIRRRKKLLQDERVVPGAQLRGRFPEAVRDMHIVEASTGVSLGAEGTAGLFHRTGARLGKKKSPGYGKPQPVGATLLRDSQGVPIYDAQGNARYTEGATRQFAVGRERELGFRIFMG